MEILKIGDERLKQVCEPVENVEEIRELVSEMKQVINTPETAGLGLAAPQLGHNVRVIVIREGIDSPHTPMMEKNIMVMINPTLKKPGKKITMFREGCLSVPDKIAAVPRFKDLKVRYMNEYGQYVTRYFKGTEAVVVQHEMDHLEGILMVDRAVEVADRPKKQPIPEVEVKTTEEPVAAVEVSETPEV